MSWYTRFQRLGNVPRQRYTDEILLFADSAGGLKTVDQDGVVAVVGGNGGSQPGALRVLDLGVVENADVEDGAITLYTPEAGEIVGPVFLRDVTLPGEFGMEVSREEQSFADPPDYLMPLAGIDNDTAYDGFSGPLYKNFTAGTFSGNQRQALTTTGPVTAVLVYGLPPTQPVEPWQANHLYDDSDSVPAVIEAGHIWSADGTFTSGGSQPDFAGNIGGSVADNGGTWSDDGVAPTGGSMHVYAYASIPVAP